MIEDLERGLLDTSVVIDLEQIEPAKLPQKLLISCVTLAELTAGPHATSDPVEQAVRARRLQRTEALFEPLPFDAESARAYGHIYALVVAKGRKPRRRLADLLIAAIASAHRIPLLTRNPDDFYGLESAVAITPV